MKNVKLFEAFSSPSEEGYIYIGFSHYLGGYCVGRLSKESYDILEDLFPTKGKNEYIPVGEYKWYYINPLGTGGGIFEPVKSLDDVDPDDLYNVEQADDLEIYTEDPEAGSMYVEIPKKIGQILCTEPTPEFINGVFRGKAKPMIMTVADFIRTEKNEIK